MDIIVKITINTTKNKNKMIYMVDLFSNLLQFIWKSVLPEEDQEHKQQIIEIEEVVRQNHL